MTVDEQLHEEAHRRLPHFMIRLIEPYRLTTYWFEIVECLRKVAIVGLPAFFFQGSIEQVLLGQVTAVSMFGVFLAVRPSDDAGDNVLQTAAQLQIYGTLLVAIILKLDPSPSQVDSMDTILIGMSLVTLSLLFVEEGSVILLEIELLILGILERMRRSVVRCLRVIPAFDRWIIWYNTPYVERTHHFSFKGLARSFTRSLSRHGLHGLHHSPKKAKLPPTCGLPPKMEAQAPVAPEAVAPSKSAQELEALAVVAAEVTAMGLMAGERASVAESSAAKVAERVVAAASQEANPQADPAGFRSEVDSWVNGVLDHEVRFSTIVQAAGARGSADGLDSAPEKFTDKTIEDDVEEIDYRASVAALPSKHRNSSREAALRDSIRKLEEVETAEPAAHRPLQAPVKPEAPLPHERYGHGSLAARMSALQAQAEYSVARGVVDEETLNQRMRGLKVRPTILTHIKEHHDETSSTENSAKAKISGSGTLKITLVRGVGLQAPGRQRWSSWMHTDDDSANPYVKFALGLITVSSKTHKKTLNPEWNQQLAVKNLPLQELLSKPMQLEVHDWDVLNSDAVLGVGEVDLRAQLEALEEGIDAVVTLDDGQPTPGSVHLRLQWVAAAKEGKLTNEGTSKSYYMDVPSHLGGSAMTKGSTEASVSSQVYARAIPQTGKPSTPPSLPLERLGESDQASPEMVLLQKQENELAFQESYYAAGIMAMEALARGQTPPASCLETLKQGRQSVSPRFPLSSKRVSIDKDAPQSELTIERPGRISERENQNAALSRLSRTLSSEMIGESVVGWLAGAAPTPPVAASPQGPRKPLADSDSGPSLLDLFGGKGGHAPSEHEGSLTQASPPKQERSAEKESSSEQQEPTKQVESPTQNRPAEQDHSLKQDGPPDQDDSREQANSRAPPVASVASADAKEEVSAAVVAAAPAKAKTSPPVSGHSTRTRKVAIALYPYSDIHHSDQFLAFNEGARIIVNKEGEPGGWWDGRYNGKRGWFPSSFCKIIDEPRQRESGAESAVRDSASRRSPWNGVDAANDQTASQPLPAPVAGKRVSVRGGKLWQGLESEPNPKIVASPAEGPAKDEEKPEPAEASIKPAFRLRHVESTASTTASTTAAPTALPSTRRISIRDRAAALGEHNLTVDALSRQSSIKKDGLPAHWTEVQTPEGKTYYWNQLTDETSWVHPGASGTLVRI